MEIWTKKGRKGELIFSFNKYLCADYLIYADSTPYKMTGPKIKYVIYITYGIKIIIEVYGRKRGNGIFNACIPFGFVSKLRK